MENKKKKGKVRVLLLTSIKTGSGHRSSANAIESKLKDRDYETKQLDVFPLMGKMGEFMENSYIPLTTRAPFLYYIFQRTSEYFPWLIHMNMYVRVRKNLIKVLDEYKPDLIISVHCMFTKAVSHLLNKYKYDIPFYVGVIDLVDPPKVWEEKRADLTFVPTKEIKNDYLKRGFSEDRVVISGFPVRDDIVTNGEIKKIEDEIKILMINPSTDLHKNINFLQEISKIDNVKIDFVCGLDERMYKKLNRLKEKNKLSDNITIHGFINNVNEYLEDSHVLLTKAGPNMIMEALHSGTAIVITGHIKGQENKNYQYVTDNGFGIKCENPKRIYKTVNDFIYDGEVTKCLKRIAESKITNGADVIADFTDKYFIGEQAQ